MHGAWWTPARQIHAIQTWVAEHGRLPDGETWRNGHPDHPTTAAVLKVFGRWNIAIRAAGFTPRHGREPAWTEETVAEAMLDHVGRHGRWPTCVEWMKKVQPGEPPRPFYHTVVRIFGSWTEAKAYAGWNGVDPRAKKAA